MPENYYDQISGNMGIEQVDTCSFDARCFENGEAVDLRRETFELLGLRSGASQGNTATSGAYYDVVEKRILIRGTVLTPLLKSVVVHELTHAWQDQHFDLFALDRAVSSSDAWVALSALVEGDAAYVEESYLKSVNAEWPVEDEGQPLSNYQYLNELPEGFPYAAGPSYIKHLRQTGGVSLLNGMFRKPPTTVREILRGKPRKLANLVRLRGEGETVIYGEELDMLRYFVLLADQQTVDFDQLVEDWRGGVVQLVSYRGVRCARIILATKDGDAKVQLPVLISDPTKGLTELESSTHESATNCVPIDSTSPRAGDPSIMTASCRCGG